MDQILEPVWDWNRQKWLTIHIKVFLLKKDNETKSTLTSRWISLQHKRLYTSKEHPNIKIRQGEWSCKCTCWSVFKHVQALPNVHGSNTIRIHKTYEKLQTPTHSLERIGKLNTIEWYVGNALDKIPEIWSDLLRLDSEWQQCDFSKLIDALRQWVKRRPVTETWKEKPSLGRDKNFNTLQQNATNRKCVLCDLTGHRINDCTEVKDPVKRRQVVSSKKLSFNCLKYGHRAADWSSCTCFKSNQKHNISLYINNQWQGNSSNRDEEIKEEMVGFFLRKECLLPYCGRFKGTIGWHRIIRSHVRLLICLNENN